jgi:hypothetical protein
MAFEVLNSSEIEVGDPVKRELFTKIKNSLDDHELRLNAGEAGASRIIIFDSTVLNAASANTMTGLSYSEILVPCTLSGCEIRIFEKGSLTGALEVDILKSTTGLDSGDFTTVFTTKPKITLAGAADYDRSTNQVFDVGSVSCVEGDTLRFDITEMPGNGTMGKFRIILYGEL